jgi:drug/metabolite transporter (DMT)-like permease
MLKIYGSLTFMIIMWSFSFIIVDIGIEYITPLTLALYRFIIASMAFVVIDIFQGFKNRKADESPINKSDRIVSIRKTFLLLLFASLSGVSLFFFSQYLAIQLIGPSLPALFVCLLAPIIISFFALIFFDEKLTKLKILGIIIATFGSFLLITGGDISNILPNSPNFIGYVLALLTPILWAIYSTISKHLIKNSSSIKINKYISYLGLLELFIFVIISNEFGVFLLHFTNVIVFLCALYLGLGSYVIGYYIWQYSQTKLNSLKVASFLYIEPFLTLIFSLLLARNELIVIGNIVGGIIVLLAVFIINYDKTKK